MIQVVIFVCSCFINEAVLLNHASQLMKTLINESQGAVYAVCPYSN